MANLTIDRSHLTEEALVRLADNTNLTHLAFGSKARVMYDILADKLSKQLDAFENNIDKAFLRGSEGYLLDYFAEVYGLQRPQAQRAHVSSEEQNFKFYTLEPNFGAINNGEDILVLKGTRIFNTEESLGRINYITIEDVVLPADESEFYFSARSEDFGNDVNVGENTLNLHNFSAYADSLNETLFVTNSASITYGQPELDDESFKFLIKQQPLASEKANFSAIETQIRQVPGVADFNRILYSRGIGTADWIIKSITPTTPSALVSLVQDAIDSVKSDGLDHVAFAPSAVGLQMFFTLTYKGRLEDTEKSKIKIAVRRNLSNYVNSLDIGQKLVLDQLINIILNSSERIESIGTPDKKFDKLVLFKYSEITSSRLKKILLSDYQATERERVIIEPGVESPISIFDNN